MKLYVEGGGDNRSLQAPARRAFKSLFERAGLEGRLPAVIACGGRAEAFREFPKAMARGEHAALLVDSEEAVEEGSTAADHLARRDRWRDLGANERVHLMVQVMRHGS